MYRVYAHDRQARINLGIRRRLAPLLGNHRRRIEFMNGLLFSMPGSPIIYYGDEIGMGDNIYLGDRDGVRTPMHWSADRNAGFSRANPQQLYLPIIIDPEYHYEAVNVETLQNNPHSLLWWMKRLIALRNRYKAFGRGTLEFLYPENHKVLTFVRRYEDECILVVANLSRFVQCAELDLSAFQGMVPIEIFGGTKFPPIGELPYFLTLGPHAFYWFALEPPRAVELRPEISATGIELPSLEVIGKWDEILIGKTKATFESLLPNYLQERRWFGGKARRIKSAQIRENIPVPFVSSIVYITMVQVEYSEGDAEIYALPLAYAAGERADGVLSEHPQVVIARIQVQDKNEKGILYDAIVDRDLCETLLEAIARRRRFKGVAGDLLSTTTRAFRHLRGPSDITLETSLMKAEQSNTSVIYGDRFILKLFRRLDKGVNPDLEIGRFLTERGFLSIPQVAGALEYSRGRNEQMTLAILQGFVHNQGDAWQYTLDVLGHYFEQALTSRADVQIVPIPQESMLGLVQSDPPPLAHEMIGPYLESARLLGQRTGELHVTLASDPDNPEFSPESFSTLYQRSLYQSMRSLARQIFQLLRQRLKDLPEGLRHEVQRTLDQEGEILHRFQSILKRKITAMRIRCHGDYHLGQVLYTGRDFIIIDFEGEPARPLSERRIKRSPLRDVAGMLRSFHYAVYSALFTQEASGMVRPEDLAFLEPWTRFWHLWVCTVFLKAYLEVASHGHFLPQTPEELQVLLDAYLLEKSIYELGYELNNRPDWVKIPIQGIQQQLVQSVD